MDRPHRVVPEPIGPGQESVWDYPRPPRLQRVEARIDVVLGRVTVAASDVAFRVLETSHPPTYYLPPDAFVPGALTPAPGRSVCEWKGVASYGDLTGGGRVAPRAAWWYAHPTHAFAAIAGWPSVMPALVDGCHVNGERVTPQPGGFYGGWITSSVVGPFKGGPRTLGW